MRGLVWAWASLLDIWLNAFKLIIFPFKPNSNVTQKRRVSSSELAENPCKGASECWCWYFFSFFVMVDVCLIMVEHDDCYTLLLPRWTQNVVHRLTESKVLVIAEKAQGCSFRLQAAASRQLPCLAIQPNPKQARAA